MKIFLFFFAYFSLDIQLDVEKEEDHDYINYKFDINGKSKCQINTNYIQNIPNEEFLEDNRDIYVDIYFHTQKIDPPNDDMYDKHFILQNLLD